MFIQKYQLLVKKIFIIEETNYNQIYIPMDISQLWYKNKYLIHIS